MYISTDCCLFTALSLFLSVCSSVIIIQCITVKVCHHHHDQQQQYNHHLR